ncbi:phytanoyl-CoA dioxygenase family protein [Alphaproteobacteria bacterium]|nr:phytanoyl-CoA dioxygenase family protein [Alphaproteobacteria bacterium]
MFKIHSDIRRLTDKEKLKYKEDGYISGLPVFAKETQEDLNDLFVELSSRLDSSIDINQTNMWHKASLSFFNLCRTPAILDYVEDLLGPNFFQWGGQFFLKEPKDGSVVPWHQDSQYWPLNPSKSVTVWMALYDTDEENAAMKVVRGSHLEGEFNHHINNAANLALDQEVSEDQIKKEDIISLNLKAGQISLHDDGLLHGSEANNSQRRRCGITMRFAPVNVKADLSVWPHFETQLARGVDNYCHNPIAVKPKGEGTPIRKFQYSNEFVNQW